MITEPTTLILGAGASWPYGFPTGQQLRDIIVENTLKEHWQNQFDYYNIEKSEIQQFGNVFERSSLSIDAFLERRQEFLTIGKLSIALALIAKENQSELHKSDNGKWYNYLLNKISEKKIIDIKNNKLFIVTFNYDRSLDWFLVDSLMHSFDVYENDSMNSLGSIMPMHMYGKLGNLPRQGNSERSYMEKIDQMYLNIAIKGINLISEREKEPEILEKIRGSLFASERIYFLGFGYDETNLQRLGIHELKDKLLKGSSYGLGDAEKKSISANWGIDLPDKSNGDVLSFMKNHVDLD